MPVRGTKFKARLSAERCQGRLQIISGHNFVGTILLKKKIPASMPRFFCMPGLRLGCAVACGVFSRMRMLGVPAFLCVRLR